MRLLPILFMAVLTSCATTLTRRSYDLKIQSANNQGSVQVHDRVYAIPAKVPVKRSKEDLHLKLILDSVTTEYTIKSSPNPTFVFGNLLWFSVSPAAYLIDLTNPKRFYYGKNVYLNPDDSIRIIRPKLLQSYENYVSKEFPTRAGQVNLNLSIPYLNSFYFQPEAEGRKINTGFWGLSAGVEYYYTNKNYLAVTANTVFDLFAPVPAPVDFSGEYQTLSSTAISFTNNHKRKRFHFGYGLNYAWNTWALRYADRIDASPPLRDEVKKTHQSIGITLTGHHQITKNLVVGLIYRPSILSVAPTPEFQYEHVFSIDIGWKIKLKR